MYNEQIEIEMAYIRDERNMNVARLRQPVSQYSNDIRVLYLNDTKYIIKNDLRKKLNFGPEMVFFEYAIASAPADKGTEQDTGLFMADMSKGIFIARSPAPAFGAAAAQKAYKNLAREFENTVAHTAYYYKRELNTEFEKPSYDGKTGQLELNQYRMMQFRMNHERSR